MGKGEKNGVEMEWYKMGDDNRACRAGQNVSVIPLHKLFGSWALPVVHSLPFVAGKRVCVWRFFLSFRVRGEERMKRSLCFSIGKSSAFCLSLFPPFFTLLLLLEHAIVS
jgi:hypothetical protein